MVRFTTAAILAVLLVAGTGPAIGQKKPSLRHLKKTDPGRLMVEFLMEECPGTEAEYQKTIDGELLRARLERQGYAKSRPVGQLYLAIVLTCNSNDEATIWNFNIHFAEDRLVEDPATNEIPRHVIWHFPEYGSYGVDPAGHRVQDTLKSALRSDVSEALADYLKANFPALSR